jgi:hypothetical protein
MTQARTRAFGGQPRLGAGRDSLVIEGRPDNFVVRDAKRLEAVWNQADSAESLLLLRKPGQASCPGHPVGHRDGTHCLIGRNPANLVLTPNLSLAYRARGHRDGTHC